MDEFLEDENLVVVQHGVQTMSDGDDGAETKYVIEYDAYMYVGTAIESSSGTVPVFKYLPIF